jgi:hypothetical protein
MNKRITALLIWLGLVGVAVAQSINGVSPSVISVDGSNVTAAKVLTLPQVQPTLVLNASPTPSPFPTQTPQISNWFPMNGNGAALVEFSGNTFTGSYSVQVSDNPTPVSTPGTNIYTVVSDTSSFASGASPVVTKNWSYYIREGWRWIRFVTSQETTNTGTLNMQVRLFGNPPAGDASRSYLSGVPWKQSDNFINAGVISGAQTVYYDYKLPQTAHGFNLYTDVSGVSGASTLISTIYVKDPYTGQLQSIGVGSTNHTANVNTIIVNPGYASPYPVATPPTGQTIIGVPVPQDIVIGDAFTGTGATTLTQTAVPIQ